MSRLILSILFTFASQLAFAKEWTLDDINPDHVQAVIAQRLLQPKFFEVKNEATGESGVAGYNLKKIDGKNGHFLMQIETFTYNEKMRNPTYKKLVVERKYSLQAPHYFLGEKVLERSSVYGEKTGEENSREVTPEGKLGEEKSVVISRSGFHHDFGSDLGWFGLVDGNRLFLGDKIPNLAEIFAPAALSLDPRLKEGDSFRTRSTDLLTRPWSPEDKIYVASPEGSEQALSLVSPALKLSKGDYQPSVEFNNLRAVDGKKNFQESKADFIKKVEETVAEKLSELPESILTLADDHKFTDEQTMRMKDISQEDVENVIKGSLNKIRVNENRSKKKLKSFEASTLKKEVWDGRPVIADHARELRLGPDEHGQLVFVESEISKFYSDSYPYEMIGSTFATKILDAESRELLSEASIKCEFRDGKWNRYPISGDKNNLKQKEGCPTETENLRDVLAVKAWVESSDRKIGDLLIDDRVPNEEPLRYSIVGSRTKHFGQKTKQSSLDIKITGKSEEMSATYSLIGDKVVHTEDKAGSRLLYNDPKISELKQINLDHWRQRLVDDNESTTAFLLAKDLEKGKAVFKVRVNPHAPQSWIPEGPDQIVETIDKDERIFRVRVGRGINAAYSKTAELPLVSASDVYIREDWIAAIRAAAPKRAKDWELAQAAVNFVREKMSTEEISGTRAKTMKEIVGSLSGDCSEYSRLLAGILRRLGIRARAVGGYVNPLDKVDDGPHALVEAKISGRVYSLEATGDVAPAFLAPQGGGRMFLKVDDADPESENDGAVIVTVERISQNLESKTLPEAKALNH